MALYVWRKDIRREMWWVSVFFGIGGIGAEFLAIKDYWHPTTITNTPIGIESFFIGFAIGGIAAVIYEVVSGAKISAKRRPISAWRLTQTGVFLAVLYFGSFYALKVDSFHASVIGLVVPSIIMMVRRKDLINDLLMSGLLMTLVGIGVYLILQLLQPGFIQAFWVLNGAWYAKLVLGIPLGEYIFYFLAGAFIGPFYEYLADAKLRRIG